MKEFEDVKKERDKQRQFTAPQHLRHNISATNGLQTAYAANRAATSTPFHPANAFITLQTPDHPVLKTQVRK